MGRLALPFSGTTTVLRLLCGLLLLLAPLLPHPAAAAELPSILHMLDYISVDYPSTVSGGRVTDEFEYAEQQEFAAQVTQGIAALPEHPGRKELLREARGLRERIETKVPGEEVAAAARQIHHHLIAAYDVPVAPRNAPSLAEGAVLFEQHCAGCHGVQGRGDGELAATLAPAPNDFHDVQRQYHRSVYGLYNAVSLGVAGTAMRPFIELSDAHRWALAFYVSNFLFDDDQREAGERLWRAGQSQDLASLTALTRATPAEQRARRGEQGVQLLAYLRSHPQAVLAAHSPFDTALARLDESLEAYRAGDYERAYQAALASYLDGFELAEPALRAAAPGRAEAIERKMLAYRQLARGAQSQSALARVMEHHAALTKELQDAKALLDEAQLTASAGFISAFVILLREGLEAILILAAIGGILIKAGRRDALPYLHAGWLSALVLGAATWALSSYLIAISGAGRELTEGVTALLASAVLLYVGFWLHGKTHADRWRTFVGEKIHGALRGRALCVLALVAFLAVYREVFETVLFYQALWMQAGDGAMAGIWSGIGSGALALALLGWFVLRSSARLPLRLFFNVNAAILLALAVVFAGHGIAAIQEAGLLPADPLPLPRIDLLGLYPTLETVSVQATVLALALTIFLWERRQRQRPTARPSQGE